MRQKHRWVEVAVSILILLSIILVAKPYVESLKSKAKINTAKESLIYIRQGLLSYHTSHNKFPTDKEIHNIDSLARILLPYVQNIWETNFSFLSYASSENRFKLVVKVNSKILTATEEGIKESESTQSYNLF